MFFRISKVNGDEKFTDNANASIEWIDEQCENVSETEMRIDLNLLRSALWGDDESLKIQRGQIYSIVIRRAKTNIIIE